jgi:hypothetical protein
MSAVCHIGRANRGVEFRLAMETTIVADATITMMWISLIARAMCLEILFADHTPPLPT